MRKIAILGFMLALASSHAFAACNQATARDIQLMMYEMASWKLEGDHLAVHWKDKIENLPELKRLQLITAYADMDACLGGEARKISFYRKSKLIGIASPITGIKLVK